VWGLLALVASGSVPRPAQGYVTPVIDAANLQQSLVQVAYLLQMVGLNIKDLAALPNLAHLTNVLSRLQGVVNQTQGLMGEIDARAFGWHGLASMNPCTATALADWNYQAASWGRQASALMQRVTSLSSATLDLVHELMTLITSIAGTTSGLQTVTGYMAQLVTETQTLRTVSLPYQQEMQGGRIIESVNQIASICVQRSLMNGWGTVTRFP
jgi:hypothetical protein